MQTWENPTVILVDSAMMVPVEEYLAAVDRIQTLEESLDKAAQQLSFLLTHLRSQEQATRKILGAMDPGSGSTLANSENSRLKKRPE